ncbi:hypothetical protein PFICI_01650 [Pestalotiopsis fici W106-1]|uniref:AAA+ ATPase domain-containing protein n=1 Tax=Pestalotiopsis fici (strain W106-1 / CGMCC3.15140) TaxID=1229662 RepID=W3XQN1_PESFW|nr:uncharacterized protein PFICI_01650 [Pestalotiopsis fici W106-1]ETS87822.1 hypothetical protein PFICI_01650 [Pestalotiopsis fici W106-1]
MTSQGTGGDNDPLPGASSRWSDASEDKTQTTDPKGTPFDFKFTPSTVNSNTSPNQQDGGFVNIFGPKVGNNLPKQHAPTGGDFTFSFSKLDLSSTLNGQGKATTTKSGEPLSSVLKPNNPQQPTFSFAFDKQPTKSTGAASTPRPNPFAKLKDWKPPGPMDEELEDSLGRKIPKMSAKQVAPKEAKVDQPPSNRTNARVTRSSHFIDEAMEMDARGSRRAPTDSDTATSDSSDSDDESDDEDYVDAASTTPQEESRVVESLRYKSDLLKRPVNEDALNEIRYSPLFTEPVWKYAKSLTAGSRDPAFTQYALLGANSSIASDEQDDNAGIFYNVTAPSSIFICGNQGSGKSHTLSSLLENCLIPSSKLGSLPRPLTGIVFHYDTFFSDLSGAPCEAAHLSSDPRVKVRILCAPTNVRMMKNVYGRLPNVTVEELRLKEQDLNTKRMLDLMAVGAGTVPLYIHVIQRVLRDLRIEQQATGGAFNYKKFKQIIDQEDLTNQQRVPLDQRLETLESFMVKKPTKHSQAASRGTDWTPKKGQLTIVDLSCPCVTAEMACSLFNICLSLFLEQKSPSIGRVAALDEAHKYMSDSPEAQTLTNSLLSTIRLQRHLALRVIISTQEPSISPKLLDLCSITIVHRFQSPDWLSVLKGHLAGLSTTSQVLIRDEQARKDSHKDGAAGGISFEGAKGIAIAPQNPALEMMSKIVKLRTGEALIFAPSAFVGLEKSGTDQEGAVTVTPRRLDHEVLRVRIRARITADGGRSIMAA